MRFSKYIRAILISLVIAILCEHAFAQEQKNLWTGNLRDGTIIDENKLKIIRLDHENWLIDHKHGKKADLQGAKLSGANLQGAKLIRANLKGADLSKANLQGAYIWDASLQEANLMGANLQSANLEGADLQGAKLAGTNFRGAWLRISKLQRAYLNSADLQGAKLMGAYLQEASLYDAKLQGADLSNANLQRAKLIGADLQGASLWDANLQGASLSKANLHRAVLARANIQGARLYGANLKEAELWWVDLEGIIFDIKPNNSPYIPSLSTVQNLSLITYKRSPYALVELREAFKKFGMRRQEREITYAIKHSGYVKAMSNDDLPTKFQVTMGKIFFDLTCQWGMSPGRPFLILVIVIFPFSLFYMFALVLADEKKGNGIYKIWIKERANKKRGNDENELLICSKGYQIWLYGLYFSFLSAFHIGWRDLNVGSWIARIQCQEYKLQACGWARSVSGIQSLLSVYLLALSVLVYFGRPFESF